MMELKSKIVHSFSYCKVLLKWLAFGLTAGILGGVLGSVLCISVSAVTKYRTEFPWLIYFLPLGGLLIAVLYRVEKSAGPLDANRVLESVRGEGKIPTVMAPVIFVSTVLTHLLGGSVGRFGASLQLVGSVVYPFGKLFRLNKQEMQLIVMAGISGVFAALFGTPLAALFFALEVTALGTLRYAAFVPCAFSAFVGSAVARGFGISSLRFEEILFPSFSPLMVGKVLVLSLLCGLVSILFYTAIHQCKHYGSKWLPNPYLRSFSGGVLLVLLTLAVQTRDYNGAGMELITNAMSGQARPEAFLLKILFTAITVAAGFKGGEVVPTFFIGSTFGCVAGGLLGLDPGFGAAIGCVALFCGVAKCPLASLFLSVELFGGEAFLLFIPVCIVSYLTSGHGGLYKSWTVKK